MRGSRIFVGDQSKERGLIEGLSADDEAAGTGTHTTDGGKGGGRVKGIWGRMRGDWEIEYTRRRGSGSSRVVFFRLLMFHTLLPPRWRILRFHHMQNQNIAQ